MLDEITAHLTKINEEIKIKPKLIDKNSKFKEYVRLEVVSKQSKIGVLLIILGLVLTFLSVVLTYLNIWITFVVAIVGVIFLYLGVRIVSYRFVRWWRKWYKSKKENFNKWLNK